MTLAFVWQTKDGSGDAPFPPVKDVAQFHVAHARSSKVLLILLRPVSWQRSENRQCFLYPIVAVGKHDQMQCDLYFGGGFSNACFMAYNDRNLVDDSICRATQLPDGMYARALSMDLLFLGTVPFWLQ